MYTYIKVRAKTCYIVVIFDRIGSIGDPSTVFLRTRSLKVTLLLPLLLLHPFTAFPTKGIIHRVYTVVYTHHQSG